MLLPICRPYGTKIIKFIIFISRRDNISVEKITRKGSKSRRDGILKSFNYILPNEFDYMRSYKNKLDKAVSKQSQILILFHPSVCLTHFYHRSQNIIPCFLLGHYIIGKHTAIPTDMFECLGKYPRIITKPISCIMRNV